MMPLRVAAPLAFTALLSAACGPDPLVGTWHGQTSGCRSEENDGTGVTIVVLENRSTVVTTTLGVPLAEGEAVVCEGGTVHLDDADVELAFTALMNCNGQDVETTVALTADAATPDQQSGRIEVLVAGALVEECELTVTR